MLGLILETIRYRLSKAVSTYHVELKSSFQKEITTQWHYRALRAIPAAFFLVELSRSRASPINVPLLVRT